MFFVYFFQELQLEKRRGSLAGFSITLQLLTKVNNKIGVFVFGCQLMKRNRHKFITSHILTCQEAST